MTLQTTLLSLLFSHNQPYTDALHVPLDIILELLESRLDEGLAYLEGDNARIARKELAIMKGFGSYDEFLRQQQKG